MNQKYGKLETTHNLDKYNGAQRDLDEEGECDTRQERIESSPDVAIKIICYTLSFVNSGCYMKYLINYNVKCRTNIK